VADIVSDIATACAGQSAGLDQINKALTQMDEVTQQNSALVVRMPRQPRRWSSRPAR